MVTDLVLRRLEKAEIAFADAEVLFNRGSFAGAINRYYYAVFFAVKALLATKKLDAAKHSGVISIFNREFVKGGQISKKASKTVTRLFNMRSEADYDDFAVFEKQHLLIVKDDVRSLIDEISAYLSREWFR